MAPTFRPAASSRRGRGNGNPVTIVDLATAIAESGRGARACRCGATFGIGRLRDNGVNFAAMIRALRSDGNTNVIATPNRSPRPTTRKRRFKAAQEVPFITGQYTNTGTGGSNNGSVNPFTTVQRAGSRHHPQDHAADQRRQCAVIAEDRAGELGAVRHSRATPAA